MTEEVERSEVVPLWNKPWQFALSRNASSPIGRPNVLWRKYVVRPTSAGKNHPSVRTIDAYANQTAIEDRGDKPSSPIKLLEGVRKGIDGEFGTAFVMNERKGKTRCKRWKCLNNVFGCTDHLSRISRASNFAY